MEHVNAIEALLEHLQSENSDLLDQILLLKEDLSEAKLDLYHLRMEVTSLENELRAIDH